MKIQGKNVTPGHGLLEKFLAQKRAEMANKLIPEKARNGRILDIGCGTIPFFLLNTKFTEKYGIDPTVNASNYSGIRVANFDIEEDTTLPFQDNFFDVVTMLAVFEHIEQDKLPGTLKEIKRVLKPGGSFVMTTPCPWSDKLLRLMAKLGLVSKVGIDEHKGAYGHQSIISYLEKVGFQKNNIKAGYFEFYLNSWTCARK